MTCREIVENSPNKITKTYKTLTTSYVIHLRISCACYDNETETHGEWVVFDERDVTDLSWNEQIALANDFSWLKDSNDIEPTDDKTDYIWQQRIVHIIASSNGEEGEMEQFLSEKMQSKIVCPSHKFYAVVEEKDNECYTQYIGSKASAIEYAEKLWSKFSDAEKNSITYFGVMSNDILDSEREDYVDNEWFYIDVATEVKRFSTSDLTDKSIHAIEFCLNK